MMTYFLHLCEVNIKQFPVSLYLHLSSVDTCIKTKIEKQYFSREV